MARRRTHHNKDAAKRPLRAKTQAEPQELDEQTGLPAHLVRAVSQAFGTEDARRIMTGWEAAHARRVTLRANTLKADRDEVARALEAAGLGWQGVSWYEDAFVLDAGIRERDVWELSVYQEGKVYLQSLSSMLPPLVLCPHGDILDMCAAPGGKTSQMAALAQTRGKKARVTACEISAVRAERLRHNLAKLGAAGVGVLVADARALDPQLAFDQVLLDTPCTGSGTIGTHDTHAGRHLTPELADRVQRSQRALIDRGLSLLKPGGTLVYSTCSVLPAENEEVVAWALGRHRDCRLVDAEALGEGLPLLPCRLVGALAVCPDERFEGFFVARIERLG